MNYLNAKKVRRIVYNLGGKMFTVVFVKANGEERKLNARRGVTRHLRGGASTIAEHSHLVGCFDLKKKEYRCFNSRTVLELRANGKVITS